MKNERCKRRVLATADGLWGFVCYHCGGQDQASFYYAPTSNSQGNLAGRLSGLIAHFRNFTSSFTSSHESLCSFRKLSFSCIETLDALPDCFSLHFFALYLFTNHQSRVTSHESRVTDFGFRLTINDSRLTVT